MATMYYEEPVSVTDSETEVETESESEIDIRSVASDETPTYLNKQQLIKAMKLADPDYNVVSRRIGKKTVKIEMYSTRTTPGALIRDPHRGGRFKEKVGSLAEYSFFKVRMASVGDGIEPVTLYYDSPEAYETHQRTHVSIANKNAWRERKQLYERRQKS